MRDKPRFSALFHRPHRRGTLIAVAPLVSLTAYSARRTLETLTDLDIRHIRGVVAQVWSGDIVSIRGFTGASAD